MGEQKKRREGGKGREGRGGKGREGRGRGRGDARSENNKNPYLGYGKNKKLNLVI